MPRVGVLVVFLLAGCSGLDRRPASASTSQIEVGKTTKSQVVEILGLPNRIGKVPQADGSTVERWFYFIGPDSTMEKGAPQMSSAKLRNEPPRDDIEVILEYGPTGVVSRVQPGSPR